MKRIIFAIAAAAMLACSCVKDNDNTPSMDKDLIGTWKGNLESSILMTLPKPIPNTFVFTSDKFTWIIDGDTYVESPYKCNTSIDGRKYFQWTEGNTTGGDAVFYSIDGSTMTILSANGTILLSLPKTLTKQ